MSLKEGTKVTLIFTQDDALGDGMSRFEPAIHIRGPQGEGDVFVFQLERTGAFVHLNGNSSMFLGFQVMP